MLLLVLEQKVLKMTILFSLLRVLVWQFYSLEHRHIGVLILVVVTLILEVINFYILEIFLSTPFPLIKVPWARPESSAHFFYSLIKYMSVVSFIVPVTNIYSSLCYAVTFLVAAIFLILTHKEISAYDKII